MVDVGKLLQESSEKFGKKIQTPPLYKDMVEDAGFRNVREDVYKVPLSSWAKHRRMKELGAYQQANMLEGLEAYTLGLFTRALGWSAEEVRIFLAGARQELTNRKLHLYCKFYYVYDQKQV